MQNDRVLNLIGLAQKAGKVVSGEFMTEKAVKTGEAALVILAEDASENTQVLSGATSHPCCKRLSWACNGKRT